jgi:hypothetical protein
MRELDQYISTHDARAIEARLPEAVVRRLTRAFKEYEAEVGQAAADQMYFEDVAVDLQREIDALTDEINELEAERD